MTGPGFIGWLVPPSARPRILPPLGEARGWLAEKREEAPGSRDRRNDWVPGCLDGLLPLSEGAHTNT